MSTGRNTSRRNRHRKLVSRGQPPCHLCACEIDYSAHYLDPRAFTVDHVIPIALGGPDEMFLPDGTPQLLATCRRCNIAKGDGTNRNARPSPPTKLGVTFVTERQW